MDIFSNSSSTLEGLLKNIIYQNEAEDYLIANIISNGKEITTNGLFEMTKNSQNLEIIS